MNLNEDFKNLVEERNQELEKEFELICQRIINIFRSNKEVTFLQFKEIKPDGLVIKDNKQGKFETIAKEAIPIICSKYSCIDDFAKDLKKHTISDSYLSVEKLSTNWYSILTVNKSILSQKTEILKVKRKKQLLNEFNKICEWMINQFDKNENKRPLRLLFSVDDGCQRFVRKDDYSNLYWDELPTIKDSYDFQNALYEFIRDFGEYAYFNADLYVDIYGETCIEVSLGDTFDILNNE